MDWIDLTVPIRNGMTDWPGDPAVSIERFSDQGRGDDYNASRLLINTHTGTHMDAPMHFISGGDGIDKLPMDAVIGRTRVIEIDDPHSISRRELESCNLGEGERILFKTRNSLKPWYDLPFSENYVALGEEGALLLAEKHTRLVGVDYLSAALYGNEAAATHRALLGAGVWIVEGINLSNVQTGEYQMICLPLKIEGCDGSPVRVLIKPE